MSNKQKNAPNEIQENTNQIEFDNSSSMEEITSEWFSCIYDKRKFKKSVLN